LIQINSVHSQNTIQHYLFTWQNGSSKHRSGKKTLGDSHVGLMHYSRDAQNVFIFSLRSSVKIEC